MNGRAFCFITAGGVAIGGATGGLLTPYGLAVGLILGFLVGPACALLTIVTFGISRRWTRVTLLTPPAVVVGLLGLAALLLEPHAEFPPLIGCCTLLAVPLLLAVGQLGANWCLGSTDPADRNRAVLGVAIPACLAALTLIGWLVYLSFTS